MDPFARLINKKCLVGYLTLGYPDRQRFFRSVETLRDCGIDALEVGLPSANPYLDGPVIADSHSAALATGWSMTDLEGDLNRTKLILGEIPLLLMGYREDIARANLAQLNSIDGIICPDGQDILLPEPLASIQLCDESMSDQELVNKASISRGFIYVLSGRGKTGSRQDIPWGFVNTISRLNSYSDLPKFVGFGISSQQSVMKVINGGADGVIIGSSIIQKLDNEENLIRYLRTIRGCLSEFEKKG